MRCEEVRTSLEAFMGGELRGAQANQVADHLVSCPACALAYEELSELASELRRARDSIRPLHSFGLAEVPAIKPRRRRRRICLAAAAALLMSWTAFATVMVLWPSFAERVAVFPTGRELRVARQVDSEGRDSSRELSLGEVPPAALSQVLRLFSSGARFAAAPAALSEWRAMFSGPSDLSPPQLRLAALGPVVSISQQKVLVSADVDVIRELPGNRSAQHVRLLVTVSKRRDGKWMVTDSTVVPAQ